MKIVVTAATRFETSRIAEDTASLSALESKGHQLIFHKSGVGTLASTYSLLTLIKDEKPDFIIQIGIAGSFDRNIARASIVAVQQEFLGDTGVEENGLFKDIFDLNLEGENAYPFTNRSLINPSIEKYNLLRLLLVIGVTVNEVTTSIDRTRQLQEKYHATIETMEGAALHYVCLQTQTPFIQLRAISNYLGERDKSNWMIKDSLENLKVTVFEYLAQLTGDTFSIG